MTGQIFSDESQLTPYPIVGYGFTHWSVTKDQIRVRFVDIYGDVSHDTVRYK